jgi:hypothetical protein
MAGLDWIIAGSAQELKEVSIEMANQTGKRYVCKKCGAEYVVTRGGNGTICCCGQPMELKK